MMRRIAFTLPLLLVLALAACSRSSSTIFPDLSSRHSSGGQTVFEVDGPIAIDVESFNGNVTIETSRTSVMQAVVRVDRESNHGYQRSKEGKASLDSITHTAELVSGEFGRVLKVRTATTDPEPHYQKCNIFIEAPAVDGVTIKTSRGTVVARGITGAVNIQTTGGDVRVMTQLPMTKPVVIVNRDGDIDYRVRGESTGRLDAETIRGEVVHRVKYGRLFIEPSTESKLLATLNAGTNPVQLRTVDGDIRIAVVENPEQVGMFIFDP